MRLQVSVSLQGRDMAAVALGYCASLPLGPHQRLLSLGLRRLGQPLVGHPCWYNECPWLGLVSSGQEGQSAHGHVPLTRPLLFSVQ